MLNRVILLAVILCSLCGCSKSYRPPIIDIRDEPMISLSGFYVDGIQAPDAVAPDVVTTVQPNPVIPPAPSGDKGKGKRIGWRLKTGKGRRL